MLQLKHKRKKNQFLSIFNNKFLKRQRTEDDWAKRVTHLYNQKLSHFRKERKFLYLYPF